MPDETPRTVVPKPTQVDPDLYAFLRQLIQARQQLTDHEVLSVEIEITRTELFKRHQFKYERTPLG